MTLKMSEGGDKVAVVESPTYIVTPRSSEAVSNTNSKSQQKKYVLIGVGVVFLAGLIIAGILVGMYIFSAAQKDIVKFALDFKSTTDGKNVKQEVESDPNDNVVMYHITKDGKSVDIVNDFNRGMQVVKMEMNYGTNCFISALNRSAAVEPSNINGLQTQSNDKGSAEIFSVSNTPITDRSFLPKKAQDMCAGVSVYWAYRDCSGQKMDSPFLNTTSENERNRRAVYLAGNYQGLPCVNGCCWTICACTVQVTETATGCQFYYLTGTCCGIVASGYCNQAYAIKQQTPGKTCTY
jgi:hypothetical protein